MSGGRFHAALLRCGTGHRKERLSGLDSLALECADLYPPNPGRVGWPDHCFLSLGQSVLRAPTRQRIRSPCHPARFGFQMAARPLALLAETTTVQRRTISETTGKAPLTHRRSRAPTRSRNGRLKNKNMLRGYPQMLDDLPPPPDRGLQPRRHALANPEAGGG